MDISRALTILKPALSHDMTLDNNECYDAVKTLVAHVESLDQERIAQQNDSKVVTCVFCGHVYPPGTPTANHEALKAHVMVCPNHPAAALQTQLEEIEKTLGDYAKDEGSLVRRIALLAYSRDNLDKGCKDLEKVIRRASEVLDEAQKHFGVNATFDQLPHQVEELFKEVNLYRLHENLLAQELGDFDVESNETVMQRAAKLIKKWSAKISERKTVHNWLNNRGIDREENGRPLCLLRRLSLLCDEHRFYQTGR